MKATKAEKEQARETILRHIEGQDRPRVYTVLRRVSSSGMSRDISLMVVDNDGDLVDITYHAGVLLGMTPRDTLGKRVVRVNGCGVDAGFQTVWNLSHTLYADKVSERAGYVLRHDWA